MTKSEHIGITGTTTRQVLTPVLLISDRLATRAKIIPGVSLQSGPMLVQRSAGARTVNRKSRQELTQRRVLDGAFLTVAMGVVALLWWSTL